MSRSLGLREDQQVGAILAARIAGLFPRGPMWSLRGQARTHRYAGSLVGMDLPAKTLN